jgi:plastocyanin
MQLFGSSRNLAPTLLLGVVSSALIASACTAPSASQPPVPARGQFTLRVDNSMSFANTALAVQVGAPLELTLENAGGMTHDFSLSDGVVQPIKIEAAGGETAHGTFVIDRAGTYQFVCSQPAHALAGMRGTIVAQ